MLSYFEPYHKHCNTDMSFPFTVVECGTLTNLANGLINHTTGATFGQTATYSCNTGFNLVGGSSATRTCQATGIWSGSAPTCQSRLWVPCTCQVSSTLLPNCLHEVMLD